MNQEATVTSMIWQPALLKVHQIGAGSCNNGAPTIAFADPLHIRMIRRGVSKIHGGTGEDPKDGQWVECTVIHLANGDSLCVEEAPEVVAKLRDASFGHKTSETALSMVREN